MQRRAFMTAATLFCTTRLLNSQLVATGAEAEVFWKVILEVIQTVAGDQIKNWLNSKSKTEIAKTKTREMLLQLERDLEKVIAAHTRYVNNMLPYLSALRVKQDDDHLIEKKLLAEGSAREMLRQINELQGDLVDFGSGIRLFAPGVDYKIKDYIASRGAQAAALPSVFSFTAQQLKDFTQLFEVNNKKFDSAVPALRDFIASHLTLEDTVKDKL